MCRSPDRALWLTYSNTFDTIEPQSYTAAMNAAITAMGNSLLSLAEYIC